MQTEKTVEELGWRDGTVAEFLGLTPEESALIEIRLALSKYLRQLRQSSMTQAQLAEKIGSSQSRIAKAEGARASVSIELMVRAILAAGGTVGGISEALSRAQERVAPQGRNEKEAVAA